MLGFSPDAASDVAELRDHYARKGRPDAARNLRVALQRASERVERMPAAGLPAPRPYPEATRPGWLWLKEGRYWLAYSFTSPHVFLAVVYDKADLPRRIGQNE